MFFFFFFTVCRRSRNIPDKKHRSSNQPEEQLFHVLILEPEELLNSTFILSLNSIQQQMWDRLLQISVTFISNKAAIDNGETAHADASSDDALPLDVTITPETLTTVCPII